MQKGIFVRTYLESSAPLPLVCTANSFTWPPSSFMLVYLMNGPQKQCMPISRYSSVSNKRGEVIEGSVHVGQFSIDGGANRTSAHVG